MATPAGKRASLTLSFKGKCIAILAVASILLYANTVGNGFVLDDNTAIVGNHIVTQGVSAIPEIFSTPYLQGFAYTKHGLYRPLPLSMFAIEWQLSDGTPTLSHLINVLVFAACVIILFLFLDELFERRNTKVAFIAALLFAVHPIHTEVVANIKSRDELMCFLFSMLALRSSVRHVRNGGMSSLASVGITYFLSLLSKESSISLVLIIPFTVFFFLEGARSRKWAATVTTLVTAIIFIAIRASVLSADHADFVSGVDVSENSLAAASSIWQREATAIFMLGKYLRLLVVPFPLISDYSYNAVPLVSFSNVRVLLSLLAYVVMPVFAVYRIIKYRRDIYTYGIAFYLLTLALFSNVFFLLSATMAERFLFFPSAGFCLAGAQLYCNVFHLNKSAFARLPDIKKSGPLLLILLVYGFLTIARNGIWKDGYTLFTTDIKSAPDSYRLRHYLGYEIANNIRNEPDSLAKRELTNEMIQNLRKATAILPDYSTETYQIMAMGYLELGMPDSAAQLYQRAFRLGSRDSLLLNNLAGIYFKKGQFRECIQLCQENVALYPDYARAYMNMGAAYLKMAQYDSAASVLKKAAALEPDNGATNYYLSIANQYVAIADSAKVNKIKP